MKVLCKIFGHKWGYATTENQETSVISIWRRCDRWDCCKTEGLKLRDSVQCGVLADNRMVRDMKWEEVPWNWEAKALLEVS